MDTTSAPSRRQLVLRGLANLALGTIAFVWPQLTLYVLVLVFGLNVLFVGLFTMFEPLFDKDNKHSIITVILGLLGILVGLMLLANPNVTTGIIGLLIAFWALLFGIADLYVGAAAKDSQMTGTWIVTLVGILSLIFGVYMLFNPIIGTVTFVWALGLYGIVSGLGLIVASFFIAGKGKSKKRKK